MKAHIFQGRCLQEDTLTADEGSTDEHGHKRFGFERSKFGATPPGAERVQVCGPQGGVTVETKARVESSRTRRRSWLQQDGWRQPKKHARARLEKLQKQQVCLT